MLLLLLLLLFLLVFVIILLGRALRRLVCNVLCQLVLQLLVLLLADRLLLRLCKYHPVADSSAVNMRLHSRSVSGFLPAAMELRVCMGEAKPAIARGACETQRGDRLLAGLEGAFFRCCGRHLQQLIVIHAVGNFKVKWRFSVCLLLCAITIVVAFIAVFVGFRFATSSACLLRLLLLLIVDALLAFAAHEMNFKIALWDVFEANCAFNDVRGGRGCRCFGFFASIILKNKKLVNLTANTRNMHTHTYTHTQTHNIHAHANKHTQTN